MEELPEGQFEILPNEIIEGICDDMDVQSLGRFTSTNKRANVVCQDILKKKFEILLATELGDKSLAFKFEDFNNLIRFRNEIDINRVIDAIKGQNPGFIGLGDIPLPASLFNKLSQELFKSYPKYGPVNPDELFPDLSSYNIGSKLPLHQFPHTGEGAYDFFDTFWRFMIQETKYVIGVNEYEKPIVISIPYNFYANDFLEEANIGESFKNYLLNLYLTYMQTMEFYLYNY